MYRLICLSFLICLFSGVAYAEKQSYQGMELTICEASKAACKNFKKLYKKAKSSKLGGRLDESTDGWELKAYTNKGSLTANINLMAFHKATKTKLEASMTYKRENKFSSWNLVE